MSNVVWKDLYKQAVLETDWKNLPEKVLAAEKAIAERSSLDGQVSAEERDQLEKARASLKALKEEQGLLIDPPADHQGATHGSE